MSVSFRAIPVVLLPFGKLKRFFLSFSSSFHHRLSFFPLNSQKAPSKRIPRNVIAALDSVITCMYQDNNLLWIGLQNNIAVFDLKMLKVIATFPAHTGPVNGLACFGCKIWSVGNDGVCIWDSNPKKLAEYQNVIHFFFLPPFPLPLFPFFPLPPTISIQITYSPPFLQTKTPEHKICAHTARVLCIERVGNYMVSGSFDTGIILYDAKVCFSSRFF